MHLSFGGLSADFNLGHMDGIPIPDLDSIDCAEKQEVQLIEKNFSQPVFASTIPNFIFPIMDYVSPIPHILPQTLYSALNGEYDEYFENLFVIDCRFNYEYEGGHIRGAINTYSKEYFMENFFREPLQNTAFVFHCEYSHNRGPSVAQMFRELDRYQNKTRHPYIFYPDVYILHGGYKCFYKCYPELCDGGYVTMNDEPYMKSGICCREMASFKRTVENALKSTRRPLSRATNSQRSFRSPSLVSTKYPNSPTTAKFITRIQLDI